MQNLNLAENISKFLCDIMNILKNLEGFKKIDNEDILYSYCPISDNYDQSCVSSTSLSQNIDEIKFIDDEGLNTSSDVVYSLETPMIEMNSQVEKSLNENIESLKPSCIYQNSLSSFISISKDAYDNSSHTDDRSLQLSNKMFNKSLVNQGLIQDHSISSNNTIKQNQMENNDLHHKLISTECWLENPLNLLPLDNKNHSHGSDLSTISSHDKIPQTCHSEMKRNDESNLIHYPKHFNNTSTNRLPSENVQNAKCEDIDYLLVKDDILSTNTNTNAGDKISTIIRNDCTKHEKINTKAFTEPFREIIYHQPPKAADRAAAKRLAQRLYQLNGFKISDVSKHLSKRNDFNQLVGEEFANFFNFVGDSLDEALRKFLEKFILCGDTQERERVIHHFSRRYVQCNPYVYNCEESCHTLVCALMLLNTDLHGNNGGKKMSSDDFVNTMAELNNGVNFDRGELIVLYNSILEKPMKWNVDSELVSLLQPKLDHNDINKQSQFSHLNLFLEVPSKCINKEYMNGYLLRKCIKESYFKKTSIGKRGWKLYFARLQDLTLYLCKDDNSNLKSTLTKKYSWNNLYKSGHSYSEPILTDIGKNTKEKPFSIGSNVNNNKKLRKSIRFPGFEKRNSITSSTQLISDKGNSKSNLQNSLNDSINSNLDLTSSGDTQIYLNHGFASKALDYSKKRNVFRLQVSSGNEYLFQVNESREVDLWVDCLNFVAALLSPPILNSGQSKDYLDSSRTKNNQILTSLNIKEQLESHQRCVILLEKDLKNLSSGQPYKSDKTKPKLEYNEQRKFIEKELVRYKTYARLLEFELVHLHNITISRLTEQGFFDPYLVPVQYSQFSGSPSNNKQHFPPMNVASTNLPIYQCHPYYTIPPGPINNPIKELSEESISPYTLDCQNNFNMLPVIIRGPQSFSRNNLSQLAPNKRQRYRNIPAPHPIIMQYPQSHQFPIPQNIVYGQLVSVNTRLDGLSNKVTILDTQQVSNLQDSISLKSSGTLTSNTQPVHSQNNVKQIENTCDASSNTEPLYGIL